MLYVLLKSLIEKKNEELSRDEFLDQYLNEVDQIEKKNKKENSVDWFSAKITLVKRGKDIGTLTDKFKIWELVLARGRNGRKYSYSIKKRYYEKLKNLYLDIIKDYN
jgi:hypothetical protein